jgi:cytoskeleton protein RodZ
MGAARAWPGPRVSKWGGLETMDEQESIGQILRHRREERGLTIEQAAFQSKVPLRLLQALEADDYHLLPDALYLIRLLHDIAVFLKLDPVVLETEFRSAIRRPPRQTLAAAPPPPPPPTIPWKQVVWTAAAIVVITPLVFITLSLTSKRAAETRPPTQVKEAEQPVVELLPPPGDEGVLSDRFLAMHPETQQTAVSPFTSPAPERPGESPQSDEAAHASSRGGPILPAAIAPRQAESPPGIPEPGAAIRVTLPLPGSPGSTPTSGSESPPARRFLLTARAQALTWISVRADGGERKQVLLRAGEVARFVADTGFVVTLGNAGGVGLTLNGVPVSLTGKSGEVIRDMALPPVDNGPGFPSAVPPRETRQTPE